MNVRNNKTKINTYFWIYVYLYLPRGVITIQGSRWNTYLHFKKGIVIIIALFLLYFSFSKKLKDIDIDLNNIIINLYVLYGITIFVEFMLLAIALYS